MINSVDNSAVGAKLLKYLKAVAPVLSAMLLITVLKE